LSKCLRQATRNRSPLRAAVGFSLLELLIAVAVGAILIAIAVPSYQSYQQRVKIAVAVADITSIMGHIDQYYATQGHTFPPDAATIGVDRMLDPWGNPYVYLSFAGLKGKGQMRKDKNLVPINSNFDLYSMGPDGQSVPPLTAKPSRDDIIMANNGQYVGVAADY
jgi:general secretion pathway protein G